MNDDHNASLVDDLATIQRIIRTAETPGQDSKDPEQDAIDLLHACSRLASFAKANDLQEASKWLMSLGSRGAENFVAYFEDPLEPSPVIDSRIHSALEQVHNAVLANPPAPIAPTQSRPGTDDLADLVRIVSSRLNESDREVLDALVLLNATEEGGFMTNREIGMNLPMRQVADNVKKSTRPLFQFGLIDKGNDGKGFRLSRFGRMMLTMAPTEVRTEVSTA